MKHIILSLAVAAFFVAGAPAVFAADDTATETKPAVQVSVFNSGKLTVPAEFQKVRPRSRIIAHEFSTGEGDQTGRMTMMASGGGVQPNIDRWKGQFTGGEKENQKVEKHTVGDWTVHIVQLSGNFAERMGGGPFSPGRKVLRPDWGMLGAILEKLGRLFFVKL
ncbi:MAG: hypothetical protein AAFN70_15865, partial [Planctomycetota bacterium]